MKRLVSCIVWCVLGCNSTGQATVDFRRTPPTGVTGGTWVAKFADERITDTELAQRFAEMNPYARARFQTVEQRRDYVEGLVRFELLAREAVRQNLYRNPEVVEAARRVMVQQLLKKEVDESNQDISDAQVAEYYQTHTSDYVKPAMTRLSHIAFTVDHRARALAVLAQVKALSPLDLAAFGTLAREYSEDENSKELNGDLRFLSNEELSTRYGPQLVAAAEALLKVGDVGPALVEANQTLHIIKLQGRQQALHLSLEQAKPSIRQLLLNETKQQRLSALMERLKKESHLEMNPGPLAAMALDLKAAALPASSPLPGFIPAPTITK